VLEGAFDEGDGAAFRRTHDIPDQAPLVCVLPGSRAGECRRLLPVFQDALQRLAGGRPGLRCVVPAVDALAATLDEAPWPLPTVVVTGDVAKIDAFAAADVALAASGTVALELAAAGTPAVVAYRVNPLTAWLCRRLIRVPHVSLVNIVLDREAQPEYLQDRCRADALAAAVGQLLDDADARDEQRLAAAEAIERLGRDGPAPSERAARVVLDIIERNA
jgi:lipid-A-disaccharide synthase